MWSSSLLNIRTERYLWLFNQDTTFLTFRRGYSGTVSFFSLQMSKQHHYHHHLSAVASGDRSQDQHSAVLETVHTDKDGCSLLWRAYNLNRWNKKREVCSSLHVRKNMEIVFGESVNIGDNLYRGVGNFDMLENEQWQTGKIWSRVLFVCFFL